MSNGNIVLEERKIGFPGYDNFVPYYTNTSWTLEDDAFYFFSVKHGGNIPALCIYHVDTDTSERLFDITIKPEGNETAVPGLGLGVLLPERDLFLFPMEGVFAAVNVKTGEQKICFTYDKTCAYGGNCISPDERYFCYSAYYREKGTTDIFVIDTITPEWQIVFCKTLNMYANHVQFFPNGEDILFAHEGPTQQIPDRLNTLNWKTGETRCLHQHIRNENGDQIECVGHEHVAGNKVLAVRYPDSQMEFGIIVVDPADGSCELVDQGDYWHAASSQDGTRFVMDTMWWGNSRRRTPNLFDVTLYDSVKKKRYVLKTFAAEPLNIQRYHVHPHFNRAGNMVIYTVRPVGMDECHLELLLLKD